MPAWIQRKLTLFFTPETEAFLDRKMSDWNMTRAQTVRRMVMSYHEAEKRTKHYEEEKS